MSEEMTSCEGEHMEEDPQNPPFETRRTRSGRKVRTPAALLASEAPTRTVTRRTRKSVIQELPSEEQENTEVAEQRAESVSEEKLCVSAEAEPCTASEPSEPADPQVEAAAVTHRDDVNGDSSVHLSVPATTETAPTSAESIPKKKPRLGSSGKQNPVIPLGKPKSGRVWKDRNKQR